jgi:hypothetical protein
VLTTGWTVPGSNFGEGEFFRTRPYWPTKSCAVGTGSVSRRGGLALTAHHYLYLRLKKE